MIIAYILGGLGCALGFTLIGIAIQYFGQIGFLLILVIMIVIYYASNKLPIDRWRWQYRRWRYK